MNARRFKGYGIRLANGERLLAGGTHKPVVVRYPSDETADALMRTPECTGAYFVPVFAVRRPVVVPTQITTEAQVQAFNAMVPSSAKILTPPHVADVDAIEEDARELLEIELLSGDGDACDKFEFLEECEPEEFARRMMPCMAKAGFIAGWLAATKAVAP